MTKEYSVKTNLNLSPEREARYRKTLTKRYNLPPNASWSRILSRGVRDLVALIEQEKENPDVR